MRLAAVALGVAGVLALSWALVEHQGSRQNADPSVASTPVGTGDLLTPAQERELHRIADLGYIAGRTAAREATGVVRHDASAAHAGYTLFTYARGPEAVLINMDGSVQHVWSRVGSSYWARAHLYPNGDLLIITSDPYRLMKIDRNSNVLWIYEKPAHHDFDVMEDGSIWVLVREATTRAHIHGGTWLLDDVLFRLDPAGRELERVSLLEAFERTEIYRDWITEGELPEGTDILHTNSVEVQEGGRRALVSIRSLGAIAMIELNTARVEWVVRGPWRMQHEAQLVDGNLLVFDNLGLGDQSRVIEVELETSAIIWFYTEPGFFSRGAGAQQRLANGNILISESESGRIVEVTPAGDVVWEFVNPRTVEDGRET
ncbi:MAG: aryl-sulfate sulfotransferase, partial [Candidatus Eisenbacteria sp.]|nr:aryl-sulfate sulfotransferase [Candidatus Eisenbacteria bacterium]